MSRRADRDALVEEVYAGCYRRLVGQLLAVTGDLTAAQDAVQEAFVKALSANGFAAADNPEAWVRTVAVNAARRRWRRQLHLDRLLGVGSRGAEAAVPELSADRVALVAALRQLSREQREAIALHYVADLPLAEVARIVGAPVGTVKARLSRGRARLAQLLDPADLLEVPHE
ncbi:RNA polymerase sigma-70 factor (ECF subfamily) [Motilibacter rhizosphaerae]|uniref:RNA polymerase sigma-70 factor (ECF subfamily) n=1 Tax=Motilibacter rhizosphaerae TaxID=598652 RepID=A0A4Q7NWK0_9ACTN|nr:sigma-70 family RNA polymerase sigma factor [Motilibacter rhizosphaerae]RZS91564.1 RNA polymerase sigma-70 factor (ECF subfamily) [Motilibacter rhizosphaerae]